MHAQQTDNVLHSACDIQLWRVYMYAYHTCMGMSDAMLPMQGGTKDSDDHW